MFDKVIKAPSHTRDAFDVSVLPRIVRWAEDICLKHRADAIVACGHSGLVVAGALSFVTRIPVVAVRKKGETTVACSPSVSAVLDSPARRWVWCDDFMSTGGTFRRSVTECWEQGVIETPLPAAILSYFCLTSWCKPLATDSSFLKLNELFPEFPFPPGATVPEYGFRT